MTSRFSRLMAIAVLPVLVAFSVGAYAADGPQHKVVFQVSTGDAGTQNLVLNNVANLQKHYGMDNVDIVVVAYGPGLSILTKQSKEAKRVESLALQNITFDACHNTMEGIKRKTGKMPVLLEGVKVVPAGVAQIVELQEKGYAYVRP